MLQMARQDLQRYGQVLLHLLCVLHAAVPNHFGGHVNVNANNNGNKNQDTIVWDVAFNIVNRRMAGTNVLDMCMRDALMMPYSDVNGAHVQELHNRGLL